jgi:hypothetical protein
LLVVIALRFPVHGRSLQVLASCRPCVTNHATFDLL